MQRWQQNTKNRGGDWLATGGSGGEVRVWDLSKYGKNLSPRVLRGHTKSVDALAFSHDGRLLATGGADAAVLLWNFDSLDDRGPMAKMEGLTHGVRCVIIY